jgi:hypothetical protein
VLESDGPLPYAWIQEGNQMTFNFVAGPEPYTDTYNNYTYNSAERVTRIVIREPEYTNFELNKASLPNRGWDDAPGIDGPVNMLLDGLDGVPEPERVRDGIRVDYPTECDQGFGGEVDYALRLPAEAKRGKDYFIRGCGGQVKQRYEAVAVDTTITVPAGTFENVFSLHNRKQHQQTYWSEKEGLIQVEKFGEEDGRLLGRYVLASKSF